jgi:hypothetical protein
MMPHTGHWTRMCHTFHLRPVFPVCFLTHFAPVRSIAIFSCFILPICLGRDTEPVGPANDALASRFQSGVCVGVIADLYR